MWCMSDLCRFDCWKSDRCVRSWLCVDRCSVSLIVPSGAVLRWFCLCRWIGWANCALVFVTIGDGWSGFCFMVGFDCSDARLDFVYLISLFIYTRINLNWWGLGLSFPSFFSSYFCHHNIDRFIGMFYWSDSVSWIYNAYATNILLVACFLVNLVSMYCLNQIKICLLIMVSAFVGVTCYVVKWQANAASGMAVNDDCKLKFLELKAKRTYRFIVFKIDEKLKQVIVETLGEPNLTYDDFTASLPTNECRYAIYDFDFVTEENCQKSKIFFIAW